MNDKLEMAPRRRLRALLAGLRCISLIGVAFALNGCINASYNNGSDTFTFNNGGSPFKADWPNDAAITCYVSNIRITTVSTNLTGINVAVSPFCPPSAEYNTNPQTVVCRGNTTGSTESTTVVAPNFAPPNCCRSHGGSQNC